MSSDIWTRCAGATRLAALDASVDAAKQLSADQDPQAVQRIVEFIATSAAGGALNRESFAQMLSLVGFVDGQIPARLAPLNQILEALPPAITKFALTEFFNDLYVPPR